MIVRKHRGRTVLKTKEVIMELSALPEEGYKLWIDGDLNDVPKELLDKIWAVELEKKSDRD